MSIFHAYCKVGYPLKVEELIARGFDINEIDDRGNSPLKYAIEQHHPDIIKLLLNAGVEYTAIDIEMILKSAISVDKLDTAHAMLEILPNIGVDINITTKGMHKILYLAICRGYPTSPPGTGSRTVFDLVGIHDLGFHRINMHVILRMAIYQGNLDTVKLLQKLGADLNRIETNEILTIASDNKNFDLILEILEILQNAGADLNSINFQRILDNAFYYRKFDVILEIFDFIKNSGADLSRIDCRIFLFDAIWKGNIQICRAIFEIGKIDLNLANIIYHTFLNSHLSKIENGHLELCKIWIQAGADVNSTSNSSSTLLHYAARAGSYDICKLLLKAGAKVNLINSCGSTPLLGASSKGDLEIVKLLVHESIRDGNKFLFIENNYGKSPLNAAKTNEIRQVILEADRWCRRKPLLLMRPHDDHKTNEKHQLSALGHIVTAGKERNSQDSLMFQLKMKVASFL